MLYANCYNDPVLLLPISRILRCRPYVAVLKNSESHADEARAFIRAMESEGKRILADANAGKYYPVAPLSADNPRAAQQQRLMAAAVELSSDLKRRNWFGMARSSFRLLCRA